jgi:hypothetical protein
LDDEMEKDDHVVLEAVEQVVVVEAVLVVKKYYP